LNTLWLLLLIVSTKFYAISGDLPYLERFGDLWFFASSLSVPVLVIFGVVCLRKDRIQFKELFLDGAFGAVWFLFFWGFVLYAFLHPAFL